MKNKFYKIGAIFSLIFLVALFLSGCKTELQTPLELNEFNEPTSHGELMEFVQDAERQSRQITMEIIGESVEEREIPALKISSGTYGANPDKIKMIIFAMLHGNEQSGKEGALMLIKEFANGNLDRFLEDIDLLVVPLMNPDGAEENQRRNAQGIDLNRDHLALESPENQALRLLFMKYMPEVSVDVHEYFPYGSSWEEFGYRKDFDIQIGLVTNPNISSRIIEYQNDTFLPFMKEYIEERGYSFHNYLVGGIPDESVTRHSTVDINDGRQSLGILNTFSMIYEGKNGEDRYAENIEERTNCQYESMVGLLEFVSRNKQTIKQMVEEGRNELKESEQGETVAIQMEYVKGEEPLHMPLKSVSTGNDTVIVVDEYYPLVEPVLEVEKPAGYLVPAEDEKLVNLMKMHNVTITGEFYPEDYNIYRYTNVTNPENARLVQLDDLPLGIGYYFLPINQLHSNMLVLALEPQSQIGLVNYDAFEHLTEEPDYPILRVDKK